MKQLLKSVLPESWIEAWRDHSRVMALTPKSRAVTSTDRHGLPVIDIGAQKAVAAATAWLCRAQDESRSADGGVARHFSLVDGWSSSYPETTGYIIPTMLDVSRYYASDELRARVRRMLDWLVSIQLANGGFQGGRVDQTPVSVATFNTGQILIGLSSGAREFGDPRYVEAMHRAARFLCDTQDADGAWRGHPSAFAKSGDKTYETHVSWGLFEAARVGEQEDYGKAGLRQVRWALGRQHPSGWFSDNCLEWPDTPLTHTIGYTLRGIIEAYRYSGDTEFLSAALRTADSLATCIEVNGRIPGRLDANWKSATSSSCLTGIVQISACWFLLADVASRPDYLPLARRANAFVRRTMLDPDICSDKNIAGGVKGSFPINGEYGRFEYLNWAAKFAIDANLMELRSAENRS
jgi:hypothetical protein